MDSPKVRQVIRNILGNALKFTHRGGTVTVHLEFVAALLGKKSAVKISVMDDGAGISQVMAR